MGERHDERSWVTGREIGVQTAYGLAVALAVVAGVVFNWPWTVRVLVAVAAIVVAGVLGLGTFVRVSLKRDARGVCRLTKQRRVAFIPCGTTTVDLRRYDAVYVDCRVGDGLDWKTFFTREYASPDVYLLELRGARVRRPLRIYRGLSETTMKDMVDALRDVAGLRVERK
jgi:hypothetical protein